MKQIPVTIFGGYLGSGKTTIIINAINQYKVPVKFAMIKNEYGDVNVDAQLARSQNIAVKEVVNGCLCCILVGELNPGIEDLVKNQQPDRIIIEASGNALPFPIVRELGKNPLVYVDGVIIVVDCENFSKIKDKSVVARDQAKFTDLIIFNKTGSVSEDKLYQVKEEVYDLNPDTVKIETSSGMIDPRLLFGINHADVSDEDLVHEHDHDMETFSWTTDKGLEYDKLEEVLKACNPNSFYRIKGIIKTQEGWKLLNVVFGRIEWKELVDYQANKSQIVFIGDGIVKWEAQVKDYLDSALINSGKS